MGPELWLSMREASHHLWRRFQTIADDRRMGKVRSGPNEAPHESHTYRTGHNPSVVFRSR